MSDWDRWERFRAPKRPPPKHGIKVKKPGTTWWGHKWIEALEGVSAGYHSRLNRGRTYARAGRTHDLDRVFDLLLIVHLQQDAVVDQHAGNDANLTQSPRGDAKHLSTVGLHREIVERLLVGAGAECFASQSSVMPLIRASA